MSSPTLELENLSKWKPKDHPFHTLPAAARKVVDEAFAQIDALEPTEMYRVMIERQQPMVYMPYACLNQIIWELAENLSKLETP